MELSRVLRRTAGCFLAVLLCLLSPVPAVEAVEPWVLVVDKAGDPIGGTCSWIPEPGTVRCGPP